jgi:hypothetical protein
MTKGFYGGGTFGVPTPIGGVGAGLYFDNHRNFYPQLYYGTPKLGISAGYSPDLEGYLTGTSVSGSFGGRSVRSNLGASNSSTGIGIGTPGFGATYGFGPYKADPAPPEAAGEVNPAIYSTGFELPRSDSPASFNDRFEKWGSSPSNATPSSAGGRLGSFNSRFGSWGSFPFGLALPPVPNPPAARDPADSFNDRFGTWGSAPADSFDNPHSPVLRELQNYRRAAVSEGASSPPAVDTASLPSVRSGPIAPDHDDPGFDMSGLPSWMRDALAYQPQNGSAAIASADEDVAPDDPRNVRVLGARLARY